MKAALLLTLLSGAAVLQAQTPVPADPPTAPEKPKLTEAQVNSVLTQLKDLEKGILAQRGMTLSSILDKLNQAIASDQAAMKFYTDCDVLVNSERKEASKTEARQRAEMIERNMERKGKAGGSADDEEGDQGLALRLGLKYLMLTLEAHETKDEDFNKMVPKLQAYIQELVAASPKLQGRALGMITRVSGGNSPVVEAYQLERFLTRQHWSRSPVEFGSLYETLYFVAEEESPEKLPELWTTRINAEGTFRKAQMAGPEYELWLKDELPALTWDRAAYLYEKGPSTINAMADMLKVIKDYPAHPDAPNWVTKLRTFVNDSAAVPPTSAPSAAGVTGTN